MPALCPFPRLGNFFSPQIQFGMMSLEKCWAGGLSSVMAPHLLPLSPSVPTMWRSRQCMALRDGCGDGAAQTPLHLLRQLLSQAKRTKAATNINLPW